MAKFSKINIPLSVRDIRRGKFNAKYLFALVLLLVLLMDFFVVRDSLRIVSDLENQPPPAAPKNTSGRINFKDYGQIVLRIDNASTFVPTGGIARNPFSSNPSPLLPVLPATTTPPSNQPATATPPAANKPAASKAPQR
jgi:hypothetical protein